MKQTPFSLSLFGGSLWLAVGIFLLTKGLFLITPLYYFPEEGSLLFQWLLNFRSSPDGAVLLLIAFGLLIGYFKARFVLSKAVMRLFKQMLSFGAHLTFFKVFNLRYALLIAIMISFGVILKLTHVPADIRGFINVAIGSALINASFIFYRLGLEYRKSQIL